MKKLIPLIVLILSALLLMGCGSLQTYDIGDLLPDVWDITTQYPYTQQITVTNCVTGDTVEFTDALDMNVVRMQLEGIQCIREKESESPIFEISFKTPDGITKLGIISEYYYMFDGYRYNAIGNGVDLVFFNNLFE